MRGVGDKTFIIIILGTVAKTHINEEVQTRTKLQRQRKCECVGSPVSLRSEGIGYRPHLFLSQLYG